jgi:SAM-dependent methyltransferase
MTDAAWQALVDAAAAPYRAEGRAFFRFARDKLARDGVFRHLIAHGCVPPGARLVDAGCGSGLLASLLQAAAAARDWPADWPAPPRGVRVTGIDVSGRALARARRAVAAAARFRHEDLRDAPFPAADVVAFIDTLHYLPPAAQDAVLARARAALAPGGALLLRVHASEVRWRMHLGLAADRATRGWHGGGWGRLHGRSTAAWTVALESLGLQVQSWRVDGRPPFANRLLVGRLR